MEARGVSSEEVIRESGLPKTLFNRVDTRLSARDFAQLVSVCLRLHDLPGLGYAFGLHVKPTSHGLVGFAMMNCRTPRNALEVAERFSALRGDIMRLRVIECEEVAFLRVEGTEKLHGGMLPFLLEVLCGMAARFTDFLLGQDSKALEMWVEHAEPAYFGQWRDSLPLVRFGMPFNQMVFPAGEMDRPLPLANPVSARAAVRQLEAQMAMVNGQAGMAGRVRVLLETMYDEIPSLAAVANRLNISPSTLKRRLQQEGTTFQQQLDDVRRTMAMRLLCNPAMSVEQVTRTLGYSDAANFTRAFRKWTGLSPSAWRKTQRSVVAD